MPPPAKPSRDSSSPNRDRFAWLLIQLVGQSVTATLKGGVRVQGILAAATPTDGDLSIALRQVIDLAQDPKSAVPKPSLLVNGRDLLEIDASDIAIDSPAPQNGSAASEGAKKTAGGAQSKEGDSFRTDVDISADRLRASAGQGRQLQAWGGLEDDTLEGGIGGGGGGGGGLENGGRGWDQFAANERQFGLKTDYDEEIYTTKLDKSGKDYKSREARAAQLEREILKGGSGITNNAHMAEERGEQLPDTQNEEDRYGAVQRSEGAYVPPGARKAALARLSTQQGSNGAPSTSSSGIVKSTPVHTGSSRLPSVASGTSRIPPTSGAPFITTSLAPSAAGGAAPSPASATVTTPGGGFTVGEKFRDFVTDEKKRLEAKKAQIQQQAMKKEHDSKLASLLQWSQSFKNPYAVPDDIAIITGKKPGGLTADAKASTSASAATSPSNSLRPLPPTSPSPTPSAPSAAAAPAATKPSAPKKPTRPLIPEIPPFNPNKGKTAAATSTAPPQSNSSPAPPSVTAPSPSVSPSISAKAPTTKLKATAGAFVFKPNAAAASFTPGASKASSPAVLAAAAPSASIPSLPSSLTAVPPSGETTLNPNANPFFGPKPLKRGPSSTSLHVKEDFTPFTANKTLPSPEQVAPAWPFSGKPYRTIYGPQGQPLSLAEQQQQQHQHQLQQQQQSMQGLAAMQAHAAAIAAMQQGGPPPPPLQQQLPQQPIATVIPNLTGGVPPPPPPPQSVPPQMPVQILSPPPPHPQQGQQQPGGGGSGFTPRFAAPPPPGQQQQQQPQQPQQQQQQQIPGLPPGMQFIPGVGLVPIGVNVGGPGGGGAGGPPVQFAQQHPGFPGQFGGGGPQQGGQGGQQRFGGGFQPGQGQPPMFTSPSMLHPSHPRHQQQQQQQQFHPQHQQQQQRGSFGPGAPPPWAQQQQQQQGPNGPGGGGGGGGGTPTMQPAQGMPPQLLLQQQQAPQL